MSQRREKRFRQLERRVAALEVQVKESHQEKMMQDISAAAQRSCVDAHWEPAATWCMFLDTDDNDKGHDIRFF